MLEKAGGLNIMYHQVVYPHDVQLLSMPQSEPNGELTGQLRGLSGPQLDIYTSDAGKLQDTAAMIPRLRHVRRSFTNNHL